MKLKGLIYCHWLWLWSFLFYFNIVTISPLFSLIIAFLLRKNENWNTKDFSIILFASLVPFGTFYIDRKYLLK